MYIQLVVTFGSQEPRGAAEDGDEDEADNQTPTISHRCLWAVPRMLVAGSGRVNEVDAALSDITRCSSMQEA
jgi:hypothetical protein